MKVQKVVQNPVAKQMYDLKLKSSIAIAKGAYKEARCAEKDFARLAVDNLEIAFNVNEPDLGDHAWYSVYGLNNIKYKFYKLFCKKTPEEKKLKEIFSDCYDSFFRDVYQ